MGFLFLAGVMFFFVFFLLLFIVNLRDRFEILSDLTKKKNKRESL